MNNVLTKLWGIAQLVGIGLGVLLSIWIFIRVLFAEKRERKKVLDKFENIESEKGIISSKDIFSDIGDEYKQLIIDNANKKMYYLTALKGKISNINVEEFIFDDIAGFEVIQNSKTELLVVGDYVCNFSTSKTDKIYMQGFRILINDIKSHNIEIVVSECIEGACKNAMPCIKEWTSRINRIMQGESA